MAYPGQQQANNIENVYSALERRSFVKQRIQTGMGVRVIMERPNSPNDRLREQGIPVMSPTIGNVVNPNVLQQASVYNGGGYQQDVSQQELNNMMRGKFNSPSPVQPNFGGQQNFNNGGMVQQNTSGVKICKILEGAPVYNVLKLNGFMEGGPVLLCRQAGLADNRIANTEYVAKSVKKCYVVPLQETRVNIQMINNSPNLWTELVEVQGAMGMPMLVPQNALRMSNGNNQPQQSRILNDSAPFRRPNNNQPQPTPFQQQAKRILMG